MADTCGEDDSAADELEADAEPTVDGAVDDPPRLVVLVHLLTVLVAKLALGAIGPDRRNAVERLLEVIVNRRLRGALNALDLSATRPADRPHIHHIPYSMLFRID